jgi:hypothetical protein
VITYIDADIIFALTLGDPDPDADGRIVAIDHGVLPFIERRLVALDRLRRRGGGDGSQEGVTLFWSDHRRGFYQGE